MSTSLKRAVADDLGINQSTLTADITELAWCWDDLVRRVDYCSSNIAYHILSSLTRSYMRGHGFKMGNIQGFHRHQATFCLLQTQVMEKVVHDPIYESLHKLGFNSADEIVSRLHQMRGESGVQHEG